MLRHEKESEQTDLYRHIPPAPEQTAAETVPAIEIYLDRVYVPSLGSIDETERMLLRDGMREQLTRAVALREVHGLSRQSAIADTLRDVDAALKEVEEQQTRAVQSVKLSSGFDLRDTAKVALLFGIPYVLDATRISGRLWDHYVNRPDSLFYSIELLAIPVVAGFMAGATARKSGPRAVASGLTALALMGLVVPGMVSMACQHTHAEWLNLIDQFTRPAGIGVTAWTLLGTLGAATGEHAFGRRTRSQQSASRKRQRFIAGLRSVLSRDTAIAFATYAAPAAMILSNRGPFGFGHLVTPVPPDSILTLFAALFGLPLASGLITGLAVRKRPVQAGLRALGVIAALLILLPSLLETVTMTTGLTGLFLFGIVQPVAAGILGWWVILGSLGTMAGQRLRGGKGQRPVRSIASAIDAFRHGKSGDAGTAFAPRRKEREPIVQ